MNGKLTAAQGYFDFGMFEAAWNVTEALPPIDRVDPLTLELRLRIAKTEALMSDSDPIGS